MQHRKEQLLQLLQENPEDLFVIYALGMEALAEKNYTEALQKFHQVIQLEPFHHASYYQLSLIYQMLDLTDVAITYCTKGLQIAEQENNDKAVREFKALLEELSI